MIQTMLVQYFLYLMLYVSNNAGTVLSVNNAGTVLSVSNAGKELSVFNVV